MGLDLILAAGGAAFWGAQQLLKHRRRHHTAQDITVDAPPLEGTVSFKELMQYIADSPDEIPHVWIKGGTGCGKTTFATALLSYWEGPIVVVGVKGSDTWAGLPYTYRADDREDALQAIYDDVQHRVEDGDDSGLIIVLDDYTRLVKFSGVAGELCRYVADLGRAVRVRLLLLARSHYVKGTGMEGESDLREHFAFISLDRNHQATIEYDDEEVNDIDTRGVKAIADRANLIERAWRAPVGHDRSFVRSAELPTIHGITTASNERTNERTRTNGIDLKPNASITQREVVRALRKAGYGPTQIRDSIRVTGKYVSEWCAEFDAEAQLVDE